MIHPSATADQADVFYCSLKGLRQTMRLPTRKFVLILIVALVVSAVGLTVTTPAHAQGGLCAPFHIVQPRENLYRIGLVYGVPWQVLGQINGIRNPNALYVGQVICLPPGVPAFPTQPPATAPVVVTLPPTAIPTPVVPGVHYPAPGTIPSISFNTRNATANTPILIYGSNFPGNATVEVFIAPRIPGVQPTYPNVVVATYTTAADGTLAANFTVPAVVGGAPLVGQSFSILVRASATGYYAYNFVWNR